MLNDDDYHSVQVAASGTSNSNSSLVPEGVNSSQPEASSSSRTLDNDCEVGNSQAERKGGENEGQLAPSSRDGAPIVPSPPRRLIRMDPQSIADGTSGIEDPKLLSEIGHQYDERYDTKGNLQDLRLATAIYRQAVLYSEDSDPDKPDRLNYLSCALSQLFDRTKNVEIITQAISTIRSALDLTSDDDLHRPGYYNSLSNALHKRFRQGGNLSDINEAISSVRKSVALAPHDENHLPIFLNNLGTTLEDRFSRTGNMKDLDEAISNLVLAVECSTDAHSLRGGFYKDLGGSYLNRFQRLGQLDDLELAITHLRKAIKLSRPGNPRHWSVLHGLAGCLREHFIRFGHRDSLEESISIMRNLVEQASLPQMPNPGWISGLGILLQARYSVTGNLADLDEAVQCQRNAVALSPDNAGYLTNLAFCLTRRFALTERTEELEDAILCEKKAVSIIPPSHPMKFELQSNLAISLIRRATRFGELGDLESSLKYMTESLDNIPDNHPRKATHFQSTGILFLDRYDRLNNRADLDNAIRLLKQAANLIPDGKPSKPGCLHHLGSAFRSRANHLKSNEDLENAIFYHRQALDLVSDDYPSTGIIINGLALALAYRYETLHKSDDATESILLLKRAIAIASNSDILPMKAGLLRNLGNVFAIRFQHSGDKSNISEAVSALSESANLVVEDPKYRLLSARLWSECARDLPKEMSVESAMKAYSIALELLPRLSRLGFSVESRYTELLNASTLACDAASTALSTDQLELALEWLEQGRSILWRQVLQLRNLEYDVLNKVDPGVGRRFAELTTALAKGIPRSPIPGVAVHLDNEPQLYSKLAVEYEQMLAEIRRLDGFERFLLPKRFSELRNAARSGPLIVLNASQYGCDALILRSSASSLHRIRFQNTTYRRVQDLRKTLNSLLSRLQLRNEEGVDERAFGPSTFRHDSDRAFRDILHELWLLIKPCIIYLQSSQETASSKLMHIQWCPTGPFIFLPIHAAGIYEADGTITESLADIAISSYTPTLSALLSPQSPQSPDELDFGKLLAVVQPNTPHASKLPGTLKELQYIQERAATSGLSDAVVVSEGTDATTASISERLSEYPFVHFACHGIQDAGDPLKSGVLLYDGRLQLSDLMRTQLKAPKFAFLSACQTATGDENLPEESVHLAAGMLAAGYQHVIATMWSIPDNDTPFIADKVYERLFEDGKLDPRKSALALHEATKALREKLKGKSFGSWVPFIHMGC